MQKVIGFIGLGNVGYPLAKNILSSGYELHVTDLESKKVKELISSGAIWCNNAKQVTESSDIIITSLPSVKAVAEVAESEYGILQVQSEDKIWIDMSTSDSNEIIRLSKLANKQGFRMLEAPVTGGVPLAHQGEITILVGGDKSTYQETSPILKSMGKKIIHVGAIGTASVMKVITNLLAFNHLWALGEAMTLGNKSGIENKILLDSILSSSGSSFVTETEGPKILDGTYDYGFTMALALKDLDLGSKLGQRLNVPLEMTENVREKFLEAINTYGSEEWSTKVVKLLEDQTGTRLQS